MMISVSLVVLLTNSWFCGWVSLNLRKVIKEREREKEFVKFWILNFFLGEQTMWICNSSGFKRVINTLYFVPVYFFLE